MNKIKTTDMGKIETTDVRINKLMSSLRNYEGADLDGDALADEEVISELKGVALKDNPEACHFVFNEMKNIIFEERDLFHSMLGFEIIEKNDRIHGSYYTRDCTVQVVIEDRSNIDIVSTMAHELRHAFQDYHQLLHKSYKQKSIHSKVVEEYMYGLEDFPTTEEHVRQVLYRISWHEIDARRYANWFTGGALGHFKETEDFEITKDNISKELISKLLKMEETGTFGI